MSDRSVSDVVEAWQARGRAFSADGVGSMVWQEGSGEPVLCLHGVPSCAFLYRKVLPELANRGLRGVAIDLPGLGFADRPDAFDYSWSGLGAWTLAAADALGLDRYHLLIHDIGGPVGFDLAARAPERVLSLTVLNTPGRPSTFREPMVMKPFAVPLLGELYLALTPPPVFELLFRWQGIESPVPTAEVRAYLTMLKRGDGGRAYLRIMRAYELTPEFEAKIVKAMRERKYPAQVAWGEKDPALPIRKIGEEVRQMVGVDTVHALPGKHFVQEDAPAEIAQLVASLTG